MALNEAESFRYSTLTEKQQHEAERIVYGLGEPMTPELTYEERVKMRRMLDQLDQKEATGAMKEFDLNKPPAPAYQYREFPFLMYRQVVNPDGSTKQETKAARNHEEREQMRTDGWTVDPYPSEPPPEIPLTAAEHAEAADIDSKLTKRRRA